MFAPTSSVLVSCHKHPLCLSLDNVPWRCDGANFQGGCVRGGTSHVRTREWNKFRCEACNFDLCEGCVERFAQTERRFKVRCHPHQLKRSYVSNGWACDGRSMVGGCVSGCTDFGQLDGRKRFRCDDCNFDMCGPCARQHEDVPSHPPIKCEPSSTPAAAAKSPLKDRALMKYLYASLKGLETTTTLCKLRLDDLEKVERRIEQGLKCVRRFIQAASNERQPRIGQEEACVVCLTTRKTVLLLPCRHLCLCVDCSKVVSTETCPLCFQAVDMAMEIFV